MYFKHEIPIHSSNEIFSRILTLSGSNARGLGFTRHYVEHLDVMSALCGVVNDWYLDPFGLILPQSILLLKNLICCHRRCQ